MDETIDGVGEKEKEDVDCFEDALDQLPIHIDDQSLSLMKGGKERNEKQLKDWIDEASSSNISKSDIVINSDNNENLVLLDDIDEIPEVIDLRPVDSSSDSDEVDQELKGGESSGSAMFKKRKHSHTRQYRKKEGNLDEVDATPGSSVADGANSVETNSGETEADRAAGASLTAENLDSISISSDEEYETPRSRVKARRIVRAADLISTESQSEEEGNNDDYNDNNSSTTEEDGATNDVDISEQTKAIVFKGISKPRHNIIHDLAQLQFGLKTATGERGG